MSSKIDLVQVLKAYDYANDHPHKYLRGTTNWCAAVAHSLNEQAAPVVERQPVTWMALNRDGFPEKCLPSDPEGFEVFRTPPELAELQATIAHLRNDLDGTRLLAADQLLEINRLKREEKNDAIAYKAAIEKQDELRSEIERLKGGRGESRLVSYATDMSTCTLTIGDGIGYFYDRVCTPAPVGFVAHRLDEIGQSYEGVIYAPAILEGAVKQGTLLYTRDNSTSPTEDKS